MLLQHTGPAWDWWLLWYAQVVASTSSRRRGSKPRDTEKDGAFLRQGTPRPGLGDPKGRFRRYRAPVGEAIARSPTGIGSDLWGVSPGDPVGGLARARGS